MSKKIFSVEENIKEFGFWDKLSEAQKEKVIATSTIREFKKEQVISSSEASCMGVVLLLEGALRVSVLSVDGREVTLYYLSDGESCVATASCIINQITFDTLVTASENTTLLVVPSLTIAALSDENIYVKCFVLETEAIRYSQTMWVMQELLFKRLDERIARYLVSNYEKTNNPVLKVTQEEIARDINSARESVARTLKHMATDGIIEVGRGQIVLNEIEKLKR